MPAPRSTRLRVAALLPALAVLALPETGTSQQRGRTMVVNAASTPYREQAVRHARERERHPTRPPSGGRFVRGSWTPYDPPDPATYPAGALTHVIVRNDTLWDLSRHYYRDPLLWPYLWDANSWIRDPHWIYPGDVLLVPPLLLLPPGELEMPSQLSLLETYLPAGSLNDFYCGHFVADPNRRFEGELVGSEQDSGVYVSLNSIVYVNVGAKDGVLPGDEFAIVFPALRFYPSVSARQSRRTPLRHPMTGEKLGDAMQMAGRLRIILLGEEVSTARVTYACHGIEMGFAIYPFAEVPIPLLPPREPAPSHVNEVPELGRGLVVWGGEKGLALASNQLVTIDLGSEHGVIPGDLFTVYRETAYDFHATDVQLIGRFAGFKHGARRMRPRRDRTDLGTFGRQARRYDLPPRLIGELVVLYAERRTATARVLDSDREIHAGDRIVYIPADTGLGQVATFVEGGAGRSD